MLRKYFYLFPVFVLLLVCLFLHVLPAIFLAFNLAFCIYLTTIEKNNDETHPRGILTGLEYSLFSVELTLLELLVFLPWFLTFLVIQASHYFLVFLLLLSAFLALAFAARKLIREEFDKKLLIRKSHAIAFLIISAVLLILDHFFIYKFLLLLAGTLYVGIFAFEIIKNSSATIRTGRSFSHNRMWLLMIALTSLLYFTIIYLSALGTYKFFSHDAGFELRPSIRAEINSLGFRGPEIIKEKPKNTFRIAVFGDSSTYGWLLPDNQTYTRLLEKKLRAANGDCKYDVINAGIPAYPLKKMIVRFENNVAGLSPDLVLLVAGANDLSHFDSAKFRGELMQFISIARKNNISVVLCSYPFMAFYDDTKLELNAVIKKVAEEENVPFLDLHELVSGRMSNFFVDTHPNARCNRIIAKYLYKFLAENKLMPTDKRELY